MALKTLPEICTNNGLNLDRVRELLRKRPDLAELGQRIGGSRAFDAKAEKAIVAVAVAAK